jgi:predicted MPP superfamily phosphohydrolase
VILEKNGENISLSGIDDPAAINSGTISERVKAAAKALGSFDGYDILLFHRANLFEQLSGFGFNLVLSGHMHGGQVRLPGLGGLVSPKTSILSDRMIRPKYFAGAYTYADMTMLVSRGLGNPMVVPRLFNRPELISIKLCSR